jgi:predicted RNase H-like nuclease
MTHRKIEICDGVRVLGLDGFSGGWVAVFLCGALNKISFCRDMAEAMSIGFDRAAIDIPIGMTDDGERSCDLLAREKLRPHSSRVFTGARRWLWTELSDPDCANREAVRRGQKRVSRQLWHLGPKIMEVDAFLRASRSHDIREVHPELVFLRLNNGSPLPSKKCEAGIDLRRGLLEQEGIRNIDGWLTDERIGTGAKIDDVLDACAVAIAARDAASCIPEGVPPRDAYGLPMQIWF